MHVRKWWRIYPLKYKAIGALIVLMGLGYVLLTAFALLHFAFKVINVMGTTEIAKSDYVFLSIALAVIVGLPFVTFAYFDWSRKRERAGDIENDARLKDAVLKSLNKH